MYPKRIFFGPPASVRVSKPNAFPPKKKNVTSGTLSLMKLSGNEFSCGLALLSMSRCEPNWINAEDSRRLQRFTEEEI